MMVVETPKWESVNPQVNSESEFLEIIHDFGDPLELVREAISNSIDFGATWIKIDFSVPEVEGKPRLVIKFLDNGEGMTAESISRDFWGLGFSKSRGNPESIGEKGHGTKIYLRSDYVNVKSYSAEGSYESECSNPLANLSNKKLHAPKWRSIDKPFENHGTEITIIGYNDNERSRFVQHIVKDYIYWFTKVGSIEKEFNIHKHDDFKVHLKCIGETEFEEIPFGHPFPDNNNNIDKLFDEKGSVAADWYVNKRVWPQQRLEKHPEVTFDAVISVEGDKAKRSYNSMIVERMRKQIGKYKTSDRYGIWLCKDYIPIVRVNEWISNFGSGSNAFLLLHGFINCQSLKLTANRGDIANTDANVLDELKDAVQKIIQEVNQEIWKNNLYTLRQIQDEERTMGMEKSEYEARVKRIPQKRFGCLDERYLCEPRSESELFGLFMSVYTLHEKIFPFDPVDYNTSRGIDIIARNRLGKQPQIPEFGYVELKYQLQTKRFNHAFQYLRWIICWDFDKAIAPGCTFEGVEDKDIRTIQFINEAGRHTYYLDSKQHQVKIEIIRFKEFLKERLNLEFTVDYPNFIENI
jgi:hypothetical protein